jgi:hypothetical protein
MFDFLEKHKDEEFMTHTVDINTRRTRDQSSELMSFSATTASQRLPIKTTQHLSTKRKLEGKHHDQPEVCDLSLSSFRGLDIC